MNGPSNKKELERLRTQMECADESAKELIESVHDQGDVTKHEMAELVDWLLESEENQKKLNRIQNANDSIREATLDVPTMNPDLTNQIKSKVANPDSVSAYTSAEEASPQDYQELFDDSDRQAVDAKPSPVAEKAESSSSDSPINDRQSPFGRWWVGALATVGSIAATIALIVMFTPDPEVGHTEYTAEMLCTDSLTWNPKTSDAAWSSELAQAPQDRLFPNHLFRLQAQSWKRMEIDGDANGVVYNLIPDGHLSELKAYVYVFKSDKDYQLPSQFDSHSTSNRRYKFWSVACQQELVFVLVYEGDEKRLHDLIKEQHVG